MIISLLLLPIIGALILHYLPKEKEIYIYAFNISAFIFIFSLYFLLCFDANYLGYQFQHSISLLPDFNINFKLGLDGISVFFIILTTLLTFICIAITRNSIKYRKREYFISFLILEAILIAVFSVLDLLLFYICFESVLIPMFLIIGIWGSRKRRIHASYQLFLYTVTCSVLMLLAIFVVYSHCGTTDIEIISAYKFELPLQKILWLAFFLAFAVKIPMVPVHIWLPEAHTEAPTTGSMILAGILLKLGTYGLLRFSLPMFPEASIYFTPLVYTMCALGMIYASLTTIRQIDLKKIIAYSSVCHMAYVIAGMFTFNTQGIEGSVLLMISHGFVSSALFLLIGIIYDIYHTRIIKYYGGLTMGMPIIAILFLFFTLANISFPGTSSFVAELLIFLGLFESNTFITLIAGIGTILGAAYALWLYNRVFFGFNYNNYIHQIYDLQICESSENNINESYSIWKYGLLPFVLLVLLMGIYPAFFLNIIHNSIDNTIEHIFVKIK